MNKFANKSLTNLSKVLRKSMTKEERKLWYGFLKGLSVTVNRQKTINKYIVDFYIAKYKIAIELDGSQHYGYNGRFADTKRDDYLSSLGLTVLRYSNIDINQKFQNVCEDILNHMN